MPEDKKVVEFRPASIEIKDDEERVSRLKADVERLAQLSQTEWQYYAEYSGYPERYGVTVAAFISMIKATVKENEKTLQRREKLDEKQQRTESLLLAQEHSAPIQAIVKHKSALNRPHHRVAILQQQTTFARFVANEIHPKFMHNQ